jgi:hypothetical protein
MDMDHAQGIGVVSCTARSMLALGQPQVLLGFELGPPGLFLEHVEGIFLGDRNELARRPRSGLFGRGDLGRLIERDLAMLHGAAKVG